jgi:hypothetical protein
LNDNATFFDSGVASLGKQDYASAISYFTEAIRLDPNYAPAFESRGALFVRAGDRAKADADFATARRLNARPEVCIPRQSLRVGEAGRLTTQGGNITNPGGDQREDHGATEQVRHKISGATGGYKR